MNDVFLVGILCMIVLVAGFVMLSAVSKRQ